MTQSILVTGGCGFIGSHTCVEILQNTPYDIIIVDNLLNSKSSVVNAINRIVTAGTTRLKFFKMSIMHPSLESIFCQFNINAVIHFAGLKAVSGSISDPLAYYETNVTGTLALVKLCISYQCQLIFSSSATVYGDNTNEKMTEDMPLGSLQLFTSGPSPVTNPYGATKLMVEKILYDTCQAHPWLNVVVLRYFNPIGAHESGLLGDNPNGIPNNLMPYIYRVAVYNDKLQRGLVHNGTNGVSNHGDDGGAEGGAEGGANGIYRYLKVFGNTYNTVDGTGCRDYIHVVDLAQAHLAALKVPVANPDEHKTTPLNFRVYNVGTGRPTSVLKLVYTFCEVNNVNVPFRIVDKREGDVAVLYCNPDKIHVELGWECRHTLADMCRDVWKQYLNSVEYSDTKDKYCSVAKNMNCFVTNDSKN